MSSDPSKPGFDQQQQTVSGDQTNVAGDYYAAPAHSSYWSHYIFIFLFATLSLLAIVAIVVIFVSSRKAEEATLPTPSAPTTQARSPVTSTIDSQNRPTWTTEFTEQTHCLYQYADEWNKENVMILEEGVRDSDIQLNSDEYLVISLTENKKPIGLIHFLLFPDSESFKVAKILNEQCNQEMNSEQTTLDNWEAFEFSIDQQAYVIRLGYQGDQIRITSLRHLQ